MTKESYSQEEWSTSPVSYSLSSLRSQALEVLNIKYKGKVSKYKKLWSTLLFAQIVWKMEISRRFHISKLKVLDIFQIYFHPH